MEQQDAMAQSIRDVKQQNEAIMRIVRELRQNQQGAWRVESSDDSANTTAEGVPNQMRTTLTTAKRVSELQQPPEIEKTLQNIEEMQSPRKIYREAEKIARYLYELKSNYVMLERSLSLLNLQYEKDLEEIPNLDSRIESMEEHVENIRTLRGRVKELEAERENLHFWEIKRKRELDREIEQAEADSRTAQHYFNSKYHIPFNDAPNEINRMRKQKRFKEAGLEKKRARMSEVTKELDVIESECRIQRQLANAHPDKVLIEKLLEQMRKMPVSTREGLRQVQSERGFDKSTRGAKKDT